METRLFSDAELETIQKNYDQNSLRFTGLVLLSIAFPIVVSIIPSALLGRRGRHINGSLLEDQGFWWVAIFTILFAAVITFVGNKFLKPFQLKKDLKHKEIAIVDLEIKKQSLIPKKFRDHLKSQGESLTDVIIFKKNPHGIKNHHYNRARNPELLKAKHMRFEIARYSKVKLGNSTNH
jgi:predicted permease